MHVEIYSEMTNVCITRDCDGVQSLYDDFLAIFRQRALYKNSRNWLISSMLQMFYCPLKDTAFIIKNNATNQVIIISSFHFLNIRNTKSVVYTILKRHNSTTKPLY